MMTRATSSSLSVWSARTLCVVLLDVSGIPGLPPYIDGLRLIDVAGTTNPVKGSIDIDGVLRLNHDPDIQVEPASWGWIKAQRR